MTAPTTGTPLPDAHDDPVAGYLATHRERVIGELFELLRIPSVSTDPARARDVRRAAEDLATALASLPPTR